LNKNKNHLPNYKINFIENSRKGSFIEFGSEKYDLSATNLRNALRSWDIDLASKFCDNKMFEEIKKEF
jgi:hypothetical protein